MAFDESRMSSQPSGPKELSRVVTTESIGRRTAPVLPKPAFAWAVLGWFGVVAVIIGGFDILLAWYPLRTGNPAWEFGIINLTIWSLPFPTTGLVFLLAAGVALESRWRIRLAGIVMLALALLILGLLALYGLTVPIALRGSPAPVLPEVKKSIVKTAVLGLLFAGLYIGLAIAALKRRRTVG